MRKLAAVIPVLAMGLACSMMAAGCRIDEAGDGEEENTTAVNTVSENTTNDSAPTNAPGRIAVGARVEGGSTADQSKETDNFGNNKIWVNGTIRLSVRCLANDDEGAGYFCDQVVSEGGGLKMYVNDDDTVTAVGADFISSRSGLVYRFQGFRANSSSNPMITENPHIVPPSEQEGTFRAYWNTYRQP